MQTKALIIGIDSTIGKALAQHLKTLNWQVFGTSRKPSTQENIYYLDLEHSHTFANIQQDFDVIYLCAALTNMAACDSNPQLSQLINLDAVKELTAMLLPKTTHLVFLSTAAVFNGQQPYVKPQAVTNPFNVYGAHKAQAEEFLLNLSDKVTVLRTSKVITPDYKLLVDWYQALLAGQTIEPFNDMSLCPVSLERMVHLLTLLKDPAQERIVHISGQRDVMYSDFAELLAQKMGVALDLVHAKSFVSVGIRPEQVLLHTSLDMTSTEQAFGVKAQSIEQIVEDFVAAQADVKNHKLILTTPVWDATHTGLFLDVCIPSLLSPNNIPALNLKNTEYLIYTDVQDIDRITQSPAIKNLQKILTVKFKLIETTTTDPHKKMSWAHKAAIQHCAIRNAYLAFIPPDWICADGAMRTMQRVLNEGYELLVCGGVRLALETFVPEITPYKQPDGSINIKPRELVKLGLQHLHRFAFKHFFSEHLDVGIMPANLYWTVPDQGLLTRCFHLHPLVTKPTTKHQDFASTIDGDMILNVSEEKLYVLNDSDDFFAFEISHATHDAHTAGPKNDIDAIAKWATNRINSQHEKFIERTFYIHYTDINNAAWQAVEQKAQAIVTAIMQRRIEFLGKYCFVTVVTDQANLGLFLNYCLPALFTTNNLKLFLDMNTPYYLIYTNTDCYNKMRGNVNFKKLQELITLEINVDTPDAQTCYAQASTTARNRNATVIYINPNSYWADGALTAVQDLIVYGQTNIQVTEVTLPISSLQNMHSPLTKHNLHCVAAKHKIGAIYKPVQLTNSTAPAHLIDQKSNVYVATLTYEQKSVVDIVRNNARLLVKPLLQNARLFKRKFIGLVKALKGNTSSYAKR